MFVLQVWNRIALKHGRSIANFTPTYDEPANLLCTSQRWAYLLLHQLHETGMDIIPILWIRKHKVPQLGMVEPGFEPRELGAASKLFTSVLQMPGRRRTRTGRMWVLGHKPTGHTQAHLRHQGVLCALPRGGAHTHQSGYGVGPKRSSSGPEFYLTALPGLDYSACPSFGMSLQSRGPPNPYSFFPLSRCVGEEPGLITIF